MKKVHFKDYPWVWLFLFPAFVSTLSAQAPLSVSTRPLAASATAFPLLNPKADHAPIHFESDSLEYQELRQVIIASGNVKVQQSSYTFFSDFAVFDIPQNNLSAWGLVRFRDIQGNEIRAKSLSYEMRQGSAKLLDTEGSFGPWLFAAKNVIRDSEGNFLLQRAKLSTCETDFRKYHLYGHEIRILPRKRLTVSHAIFRLGPVPILYLPYYYYSLGEKHLGFQIFPGNSQTEGPFARTVWGYPTSDETYTQLYLDYMSRRGFGKGAEMNYFFPNSAKGSLYGYHISDSIQNRERWNTRFFHWQQLSPGWIVQSRINKLSDESFPNDFFREDFDRVARDVRSNLAFTYQKNTVFFRGFTERNEIFDPNLREYYPQEILMPGFEVSQIQTPLGFLGLQKILFLSVGNRYAGKNPYGEDLARKYRLESNAVFSVLRQFLLPEGSIFVPRVNLRNVWTDHPQVSEPRERFIQKLETESTLRHSFGRIFDVDLTYRLVQRLQENGAEDQGREVHSLSYLSVLTWSWLYFRFETGHNLPRNKSDPVAFSERKNYLPLRGEVSVTALYDMEFFYRQEYVLYDPNTGSMHPLSSQGEMVWGKRALGEPYFSLGSTYLSSRDHAFELRAQGRVSPTETIRLEGTLRTLFNYLKGNAYDVRKVDFLEKELLARKEWRCWDLSFIFRERSGVLEFLFNLELKLDRMTREKRPDAAQGTEWYPWRGLQ